MNYIVFAEKCLELATQLYKSFANSGAILSADGLLKMIDVSVCLLSGSMLIFE